MDIEIPGLHHVTAITAAASGNATFYTQHLGMRLAKKSVNQDDLKAYHLYYGDEVGKPGTEVTFFDWPQTPPTIAGAGTIAPIALRVPGTQALEWWERRFDDLSVGHDEIAERDGRAVLAFTDPEGQRLELVDDGGVPGGTPWARSPVPAGVAITGLHGVTITSRRPDQTAALLTRVLGFRQVAGYGLPDGSGSVAVFETGAGGPGTEVRVIAPRAAQVGMPGAGGVHHVAFQTPDEEQQLEWRARLTKLGLGVTPVVDRFYFKSLYFREPGGALFEIATMGPGFLADESLEELGEHLSLPVFLEPRREEIEANLRPITISPLPG